MIKHSVTKEIIHLTIANMDFSYRIPIKKIGSTINWKIGENSSKGIVLEKVSKWTLQLFTNKVTELKYVRQFRSIVLDHLPNEEINWEDTFLAVNIQNEYNWVISNNKKAEIKITESEIIANLKEKYKLD